jgi:hypothetical protein
MLFYTGASVRLTLASTGAATFSNDVTTTSSTGAFAVVGAGSSNTNAGSGRFVIYDTTNNRGWGMQQDASYKLNFWHYNGSWSSVANISSTGAATFSSSVGINGAGTSFPLSVKVATNQNVRISSETSTSIQAVNDAANAFVTLKLDGSSLLLNSQSGGNVGIGTTSPNQKLTVRLAGAVTNTQEMLASFFYQSTGTPAIGLGPTIAFYTPSSGDASQTQTRVEIGGVAESVSGGAEQTGIVFKTPSSSGSGTVTERMRITAGGNIGIGTTFVIGSYLDTASQSGVIQQATNIAKASTARDVNIAFFGSNDATNALGLVLKMRTGSSIASRQMVLQGTEIGFSPNNILLQTDGAKVGIGTNFGTISASPVYTLEVSTSTADNHIAAIGTAPSINVSSSSTGPANWGTVAMATTTNHFITGAAAGDFILLNRGSTAGNILFGFGSAERMRLTNSGNTLLIGQSSSSLSSNGWGLQGVGGGYTAFSISNNEAFIFNNLTTGTTYQIDFRTNSIERGSISVTDSGASYNTTSDYRVKEDFKSVKGLDLVSKINVYDFKFKDLNKRMDGVIAHELQEILPYAVQGIKDGKKLQSVDYSKIVPVLIQSIKELKSELDLIKNK